MTVLHSSINDIDPTQWELLVQHSPTASFFQTRSCYDFYASLSFLRPFVFGISENEKLVGVICGYSISDGGSLKKFFSRRAIVPGGLLLDAAISSEALIKLLKYASDETSKKSIYLELRNYNDYSAYRTTIENAGFTYNPHLNFHVLTNSVDAAFMKLNTTKRRDVRLSKKEGAEWLETKNVDDIRVFFELLKNLYETKIKTPLFEIEFFEKLIQLDEGKLFVVKYNDRIIGGSVCVLLENKTLYEWFVCGLDGQIKNIFPSTLATWAAIEYAAANGYSRFDMMGAGKPDEGYGVREFKSKFGGEQVEHGRFIHIHHPLLYNIGKLGVEYFRLRNRNPKKTKVVLPKTKIEFKLDQIDKQAWADFVLNHPNGSIFQTPQMYEVYEKTPNFTPNVLVAFNEKGKIVGCLMSVVRSDFSILKAFTTRSIVMGGPLALNNNTEIVDQLLKYYNQFIGNKAIFSQFRNQFDMSAYKPVFKKNGYEFDEHLDILVDLTCSVEQLEQNLHKERKRNIAKAGREGLVFKHLSTDEEINTVSGLLKKTYNRVKLPMIFQQLFLNTRNLLGDEVHFFGAYYGNKMIAGQVRLYYKDVVYAWYAGSNAEYFNKRPNDFLMWNVLLWSKEKGYKLFDFGGAGKPNIPYGVREYKLKYGGQLVSFGRFEKTHKQLFMMLGKRALKLYKVIKK